MEDEYQYLDAGKFICEDYPKCWRDRQRWEGGQRMCESCIEHVIKCKQQKMRIDDYFDSHIDLFELEAQRQSRARPAPKPRPTNTRVAVPAHASVYELTLTTTKDDPYELRQFLTKFTKSAMYAVAAWSACIELTQAGLPHIHAIIYSKNKYLNAAKIKNLGFQYRYELKLVRDEAAYNNYILKEKNNPIIIEYCQRKGIPQFWSDGIRQEEDEQAPAREEAEGQRT